MSSRIILSEVFFKKIKPVVPNMGNLKLWSSWDADNEDVNLIKGSENKEYNTDVTDVSVVHVMVLLIGHIWPKEVKQ